MNESLIEKLDQTLNFKNIPREKLIIYLWILGILIFSIIYLIYLINRKKTSLEKNESLYKKDNKLKNVFKNIKIKNEDRKLNKPEKINELGNINFGKNIITNKKIQIPFEEPKYNMYEEEIRAEEKRIIKELAYKNAISKLENILEKDKDQINE